ncbi:ABC transporter substrate-binding protein [Oceanobacillus alkalisoli]|uniref:ABC transporter substrate-binding protein n=1 Tax=Oceanobacillus alkalisoli TaxID=2925113 RepID=UPI001EE4C32F|nr:helical backbone metal receptor [Oceanobacillus alkalisoli]
MSVRDHLGRLVPLVRKPERIISFVPAITETMYHLGLDKKIVGRTRFCKFPEDKVQHAVNIGGTKDMKLDRIHELKPDLIIAEKEENTKEMVETLEKHYPVFVFEVQHFKDVFPMIEDIGRLTDREKAAIQLMQQIKNAFQVLPHGKNNRVAYVIWQKPYMVVGKDTYINSLLEEMGFSNPFTEAEGRYPMVNEKDFKKAKLDEVFLATEPFPFREKHLDVFEKMLPHTKVRIVDGEMFWYGAKMVEAAAYFKTFREE